MSYLRIKQQEFYLKLFLARYVYLGNRNKRKHKPHHTTILANNDQNQNLE